MDLPVIDLAKFCDENGVQNETLTKDIVRACEEWGCFCVTNTGVPDQLTNTIHEQMVQFFDLPITVKRRNVIKGPNERRLGYTQLLRHFEHEELVVKEALADVYTDAALPSNVVELAMTAWPDGNKVFGIAIREYCAAVHTLGRQLLELLGAGLGLKATFFTEHLRPSAEIKGSWRLHHYPRRIAPSSVLRTGAHRDPSIITILNETSGDGLQVQKPRPTREVEKLRAGAMQGPTTDNDVWLDVRARPGSFVIIVGDIMEAWSNGRLRSLNHRVVLDENKERYSVVNFFDPVPNVVIEAPTELIDDHHPPMFSPFVAGNYRLNFEKSKLLHYVQGTCALDCVRKATPVRKIIRSSSSPVQVNHGH